MKSKILEKLKMFGKNDHEIYFIALNLSWKSVNHVIIKGCDNNLDFYWDNNKENGEDNRELLDAGTARRGSVRKSLQGSAHENKTLSGN